MSIKKVSIFAAVFTALATVSQAQALAGFQCPGQGFKSYVSNQQFTMTVVNQSVETVDVYWSDFQGNAIFYKSLHPGQSYNQPTYSSHSWVFWQNNRCEYHITMPTADQTIYIR